MVNNNESLTLKYLLNAFKNIARLVEILHIHVGMHFYYTTIICTNSTDRDHRWLEWFEQKFSGLPDEINFEQFKKALHIKEVKLLLALYMDP